MFIINKKTENVKISKYLLLLIFRFTLEVDYLCSTHGISIDCTVTTQQTWTFTDWASFLQVI